jgi:hypothetical protein
VRITVAQLAIALVLPWSSAPQARQDSVPFVGCPADGQTGPIAAPSGAPMTVPLANMPVRSIAYYRGEQAPGVFAPRGWHCRVWYGSSGSGIVVSAATIDSIHLFPPPPFRGPAVELDVSEGGTSGRFSVAFAAARLFPRVAAGFIEAVKKEGLVPASRFPRGPYPTDTVTYLDSLTAEFITPPHRRGMGTEGYLAPSKDAIHGIAVLSDPSSGEPDLLTLGVRLRPEMQQLEEAILQLNRHCMLKSGGC